MTINYKVNDVLTVNKAYVYGGLSSEISTGLKGSITKLLLFGREQLTVAEVGEYLQLGYNLKYIRLVTDNVLNTDHRKGKGITVHFDSDVQLNNSLDLVI